MVLVWSAGKSRADDWSAELPHRPAKAGETTYSFWHSVKNVLGFVIFDGFQLILFYVPHTLFWHSVKNVLGFVICDGFQLILFYVPHTLLVVFVTVFPVEPFAAFLLLFFCLIVGILLL